MIIFFIINQKPKFCAMFSLRLIQMRTLAQNKYIHILQGGSWGGGGGGLIALRSQRNAKLMEALRFFYRKYYIQDAKIYPVMMWIQIHARGADFFFIKSVQYGTF